MRIAVSIACGLLCGLQVIAASAAERLQLVERALTDATVDLGAKGDSAGDLLTFANPIFDAANQTQVGTDQGYCVRIVAGKSWECFWTLRLKEGQITVDTSATTCCSSPSGAGTHAQMPEPTPAIKSTISFAVRSGASRCTM